jgi:hypothetical protein
MNTPTPNARRLPVIDSYGMGVESTAIALRWIEDPASRDFPLDDLIVVTAMTGNEWPDTRRLVEEHVLPAFRDHGIRYVQLARGGPLERDGVDVLSDSRSTERLVMAGAWTLADELELAGTVPQFAHGQRRCSQKFKGWPIDFWLRAELGHSSFRHVIGFNAGERWRMERDASYATALRAPEYPLAAWGWDRKACERYLHAVTGEWWPKSCCTFCPFAGDHHIDRYRDNPDAAVHAMRLEYAALALNPRMTLFKNASVIHLIEQCYPAIARRFRRELESGPWSLYEVRRVFHAKGVASRSVRCLTTASHRRCRAQARREASHHRTRVTVDAYGIHRVVLRDRNTEPRPVEAFLVVAPAGIEDKERRSFAASWQAATA